MLRKVAPFFVFCMGKKKKERFIFTNKENPTRGIMSTILGAISIVSIILVIVISFRNGGTISPKYGVSLFLAMIFSVVGVVLGAVAKTEKDKFYLFCYIGIALNLIALLALSMILYIGSYI